MKFTSLGHQLFTRDISSARVDLTMSVYFLLLYDLYSSHIIGCTCTWSAHCESSTCRSLYPSFTSYPYRLLSLFIFLLHYTVSTPECYPSLKYAYRYCTSLARWRR